MRLALCILIAEQIGDVATTIYGLESGVGHEGNPVALAMLDNGGIGALVAAKAVAIVYLVALFVWLPLGRGFLGFVVRAAAIAYAFLIYSNLRVGGLI